MNAETKGMLVGGLGIATFGVTLPVTRWIAPEFGGAFIGLGRAVFAAFLAGLVLLAVRPGWPSAPQFKRLIGVAAGVVVGFPLLASMAMDSVPASHGGIVLGLLPLGTALAGVLVSHERPSFGFWLCGLVGAGFVIGFALQEGAGQLQLGDLALVGAIVCASMGYAIGGKLATELGGWQVISWGLILALPFVAWPMYQNLPADLTSIPQAKWFGFAYLCIVSQYLGFFLWYKGLALGGIARVSQVQLLQPFVTLGVAAAFLGEFLGTAALVALVAVTVSVALGRRMPIRA
ncbi:MAG: DMT family transporter [Planctomycetes bacterium]|nr:DMT family transporter [Planctomycetota bacterium]